MRTALLPYLGRPVLFLLLVTMVVGCDFLGGNSDDCEGGLLEDLRCYPATFSALSQEERNERSQAFHRESDGQICSMLDAFGFASGDGCVVPRSIPDDTLTREEAVQTAKQEIAAYEEYTNVPSAGALNVKRASPSFEGKVWRVIFQDQTYRERPVHQTGIYAWLSADGVYRIDRHWYRDIVIPETHISREEALEKVIGYEIGYSDWTGADTIRVSDEDLPPPDSVRMGVWPHRTEEELQLRVVWEVEVAESFFRVYVDVVRGSVVDHTQLVVF